jgi:hypothetical protein
MEDDVELKDKISGHELVQRLISCPQLEQNYFPIFNSNNCIDHVLWAI